MDQRKVPLASGRLDPVTGLPNRKEFVANYQPRPGAQLVMISICNAKQYDELLHGVGHEHAEDFLRAIVARLAEVMDPAINIYQVSALALGFILPFGVMPTLLRKITQKFSKPLFCGGIPVMADIAIGVADCHDADAAFVLRAGLSAARDCRETGRDWARYNRKTDNAHQRGFLLLSHLNAALKAADQLHLHFQPKYDMGTGQPNGAEALLRWRHPVFGNVSPAEFIPLAEATAHIHPLTEWVLQHAIAQAGAWAAKGLELTIAINVSPRSLTRRGFAARVVRLLNAYGVEPARIELEFTEGVLVSPAPVVLEELRTLRAAGIRVALDDFGTGFANFSYITHLPADIIKIDKSFIQRIAIDPRASVLVRSLIELAHELDYRVVAEGIESEKAYGMLKSWSCDEGQGFYMSPPVDAATLAERINRREITAAL